MTLEKLCSYIENESKYVISGEEKYVRLNSFIDELKSIEETYVVKPKVELTQAQADFLGTFRISHGFNVIYALYLIGRSGWGHYLMDGEGVSYKSEPTEGDKNLKELMIRCDGTKIETIEELKKLLIEALFNGYIVKEVVPLYKCVLDNRNNPHFDYLVVRRNKSNSSLYMKSTNLLSDADVFTEEEAREQLDLVIPYMERVN